MAAIADIVHTVMRVEKMEQLQSQPHRARSFAWLHQMDDCTADWRKLPVVVWVKCLQTLPAYKRPKT